MTQIEGLIQKNTNNTLQRKGHRYNWRR